MRFVIIITAVPLNVKIILHRFIAACDVQISCYKKELLFSASLGFSHLCLK